ncbi:MAG: LysR family transcriptional regulator [Burkholderiaceae bacterium]
MNKLQAMEVFVHVVDTGGFTRAAERLGIPKATVTTAIRNLETALKVRLLNRTTRRAAVTADGAAYYERCVAILDQVRDAEESVSTNQTSASGRLRVDVATSAARWTLIPALADFQARYPDIRLELGCSDRPVNLIGDGVDCALRAGEILDQNLIARRISTMHFITCATPAYLASHGRPEHPRDLEKHRCINYFSTVTGRISQWDFDRGGERLQLTLDGPLAVNDSSIYFDACLAGLGIAQLPTSLIREHIESGRLEIVLGAWLSEPLPIHIVYPPNRNLSNKVRVFVEWIADLFEHDERLTLHSSLATTAGSNTVVSSSLR